MNNPIVVTARLPKMMMPAELAPIFEPKSSCLKRDVFLYFLEDELARAQRHRLYVSLLLFQLDGASEDNQTQAFGDVAEFLAKQLRKIDYLGKLERTTLGVVLLNSRPEKTRVAMEIFKSRCYSYILKRNPKLDLRTSSSIFPNDGNTVNALYLTALDRLAI